MTVTAGPYEAKIPRTDAPEGGYRTAEQELAAALEGTAPRLAHDVADVLGPARTAQLAQIVRRAVAVGIRRRAEQETATRLAGAYDLLAEGLNQITAECEAPEPDPEPICQHTESLYGRCVACGMTWTQQACACAVLSEWGVCVSCGKLWKHQEVADRGEG